MSLGVERDSPCRWGWRGTHHVVGGGEGVAVLLLAGEARARVTTRPLRLPHGGDRLLKTEGQRHHRRRSHQCNMY